VARGFFFSFLFIYMVVFFSWRSLLTLRRYCRSNQHALHRIRVAPLLQHPHSRGVLQDPQPPQGERGPHERLRQAEAAREAAPRWYAFISFHFVSFMFLRFHSVQI
jgi:hypothetical protein